MSTAVPERERPSRVVTATTDAKGRYDLGELPPGEYTVTITRPGFEDGWFNAVVDPRRGDDDKDGIPFSLRIQPPLPPPPPALVRHADVPIHPIDARRQGIEGTVRLRIGPSREVELLDGPPLLADAAIRTASPAARRSSRRQRGSRQTRRTFKRH